jgi:hypothetical protein
MTNEQRYLIHATIDLLIERRERGCHIDFADLCARAASYATADEKQRNGRAGGSAPRARRRPCAPPSG